MSAPNHPHASLSSGAAGRSTGAGGASGSTVPNTPTTRGTIHDDAKAVHSTGAAATAHASAPGLIAQSNHEAPAPALSTAAPRTISVPKIDIHTHILPDHMPDWGRRFGRGYDKFVRVDHYCECKAKMYRGDRFFREIEENCYRPEPRLRDCDAAHVGVQVLSTVPVMFNYDADPQDTLEIARFLNDHISALCNKYPSRFIGLGTLPMQAPTVAIEELRRIMRPHTGMAGIQIGSSVNDWPLSDPNLFPIFAECERLNACVFVHPWDMPGSKGGAGSKYWLPWLVEMPALTAHAICHVIFSRLLDKLPHLRICFAHGGGSFPGTIGRIEHGHRVRPDLVAIDNATGPREYLYRAASASQSHTGSNTTAQYVSAAQPQAQPASSGPTAFGSTGPALAAAVCGAACSADSSSPAQQVKAEAEAEAVARAAACGDRPARFWVDSLVHDPDALHALLKLFGEHRICLGSDYPFPLGEHVPGSLVESMTDLEPRVKELILFHNALELLGLTHMAGKFMQPAAPRDDDHTGDGADGGSSASGGPALDGTSAGAPAAGSSADRG